MHEHNAIVTVSVPRLPRSVKKTHNNNNKVSSAVVMYSMLHEYEFVCVEVLRPIQPTGVMSSAVSLPNHTFTVQA